MVIVFGSINVDLIARVEHLPRPGETVVGEAYALHPGGKGANQALAARLAGAEVALLGTVGQDGFAEAALAHLARAGVDLDGVAHSEAPTGLAMIPVDRLGENQIVVAAGANAQARAAALAGAACGAGDTLLLQLELPVAETAAAAVRTKAQGARVVLNLAPMRAELPPDLLFAADLFVANEGEALAFARTLGLPGQTAEAAGAALSEHLDRAVVVTLGSRGAAAFEAGRRWNAPALPVTVEDTTGAGDTFCGVLGAALDGGATLDLAVARANAAAALACTRPGAQSSMPNRAELDTALARTAAASAA